MPRLRDTGIAIVAGCLLALACLAPAASASDSVYWSSYQAGGAIRVGGLDGTGARDLVGNESSPEGIAIDPAAGKIYWADTTTGAIRVANLDGSGAHDLYTGESQPSGVAIDPATGKIYWANSVTRTGAIRVANLDGSGVPQNLFSNESYPVGVTIDPATGKIYWGSYDTFVIRSGNLNGTGAHDLFTGENYPTGIVVDDAAGKIYWTNEFAGQIRVGNLNGTGATNLFAPKGGIGGLALDPGTGKLYWGDFQDKTIEVGNANGTGAPQSLFSNELSAWFVALLRAPSGTGAPQVTGSQTIWCAAVVQSGKLGSRRPEHVVLPGSAHVRLPVVCERGEHPGRHREHVHPDRSGQVHVPGDCEQPGRQHVPEQYQRARDRLHRLYRARQHHSPLLRVGQSRGTGDHRAFRIWTRSALHGLEQDRLRPVDARPDGRR